MDKLDSLYEKKRIMLNLFPIFSYIDGRIIHKNFNESRTYYFINDQFDTFLIKNIEYDFNKSIIIKEYDTYIYKNGNFIIGLTFFNSDSMFCYFIDENGLVVRDEKKGFINCKKSFDIFFPR